MAFWERYRFVRGRPTRISLWPESRYIRSHAMFRVYLSRVVAGLGFLIFTWSTVVLLGGFVSMLSEEDFWSLTTFDQALPLSIGSRIGTIQGLRIARYYSSYHQDPDAVSHKK
uniref:Uncharacterized protein n=1 Tax=Leersia perrieri TaxID=77586 RepID=A0A0D9XZH8_9ORYZ